MYSPIATGIRALLGTLLVVTFAQSPSVAQAVGESGHRSASVAGTWDLTWQTRKGPVRNGYLVVRQEGTRIHAQIHGRGAVKASGTTTGNKFVLRGTRMAVPYVMEGSFHGDSLTGQIRVLSIVRSFTGKRRA